MDKFIIDGQYKNLLEANNISPKLVLQQANLPIDTFAHQYPKLNENEYFKLLEAIDVISADPMLSIRLVQENNLETFSPSILAAYCSKNGEYFIHRLAHYKKLMSPVTYQIEHQNDKQTIKLHSLSGQQQLPEFFVKGEFSFLIEMISRAVEQKIKPLEVITTFDVVDPNVIEFFGVSPRRGLNNAITFSNQDLQRDFKSKNDSVLDYLEPELKKHLEELEVDDSYAKRVRHVLVELLPSGVAGIDEVSHQLGISRRTLQRNLKKEKTSFQQQLNETREMLAKNYLINTKLSIDEIAFLLAYQETNSFQRAFSIWTDKSAYQFRNDSNGKYRQKKF